MDSTLSNLTGNHNNNFNIIRFLAATFVIFSHSYNLTLTNEPIKFSDINLGKIGVDIFFVTSGYLVTSSFFKRSLSFFIWSRIIRIWPALIVSLLFCVLVIGPLCTQFPMHIYFSKKETYYFIIYNTLLPINRLKLDLPGVFERNPFKLAVNGSLWTLPKEVRMYIILAFVGYVSTHIKYFSAKKLILIIATSSAIYFFYLVFINKNINITPPGDSRFFYLFFLGSCFWIFQKRIVISNKIFFALIFVILSSYILFQYKCIHINSFIMIYYIFLIYFVIFIAYYPSGIFLLYNKVGDYSYGLYIYSFPIQQTIIYYIPSINAILLFIFSFLVSFLFSIMSWYLIEKKALKFKYITSPFRALN